MGDDKTHYYLHGNKFSFDHMNAIVTINAASPLSEMLIAVSRGDSKKVSEMSQVPDCQGELYMWEGLYHSIKKEKHQITNILLTEMSPYVLMFPTYADVLICRLCRRGLANWVMALLLLGIKVSHEHIMASIASGDDAFINALIKVHKSQ